MSAVRPAVCHPSPALARRCCSLALVAFVPMGQSVSVFAIGGCVSGHVEWPGDIVACQMGAICEAKARLLRARGGMVVLQVPAQVRGHRAQGSGGLPVGPAPPPPASRWARPRLYSGLTGMTGMVEWLWAGSSSGSVSDPCESHRLALNALALHSAGVGGARALHLWSLAERPAHVPLLIPVKSPSDPRPPRSPDTLCGGHTRPSLGDPCPPFGGVSDKDWALADRGQTTHPDRTQFPTEK